MEDFFDYEAGIFALGGDVTCPDCGMGLLVPISIEDAQQDTQRLVCDVCDEELECGHPDNPCL